MAIPLEGGRAHAPARKRIRATQFLFSPALQFGNVLAALLATRQAVRRLKGLDDGALKDIGVPRGGIEWAARHGREDDRPRHRP